MEGTYPRGLDVEVFTFAALRKAWHEASADFEHVHVTPYIYQHPEQFRMLSVTGRENASHYRWTVDTREDLALIRTIYEKIDRDDLFSWRDALELFKREPNLAEINRHIRQKSLEEC
jgi:spore coat polysaccharide biosynthesis protein SpsF